MTVHSQAVECFGYWVVPAPGTIFYVGDVFVKSAAEHISAD